MDWYGIVLAALSATVATGVAELLFRGRRRGVAYSIALVICFVAINGASRQLVLPIVRSWEGERSFEASPALSAIARLEPQVAAEIKKLAVSRSPNAQLEIRARAAQALKKYGPRSSDQAIINLAKVSLQNGEALQARDPALCYSYFFPAQSGVIDISKHLPKAAIDSELTAVAEVLQSAADAPQPVPSEKDAEQSLQTVFERLGKRFSNADLALLERASIVAPTQRALVCALTLALHTEVLGLPLAQQGSVLRYLLTD